MELKFKTGSIKAITEDSDFVYIEGWANYSKPDEIKERLDPLSMDDSRYIDNPVVLFNHNTDFVVGKSVKWEKKPEGVWIRAAITKSKHESVTYIRDLVVEGILKCFSVGFSGGTYEKDPEHPGAYLTKNWKLHEVSIVPIPMQANSTFSVAKSFDDNLRKCKSLSEARIITLQAKGAAVAALIAPVLEKMDASLKQDAINKLAETAQISPEEALAVVTGETATVPEKVLGTVATVFGLNIEELTAANAKDASTAKPNEGEENKPAEGGQTEDNKPNPEPKTADPENKEGDKPKEGENTESKKEPKEEPKEEPKKPMWSKAAEQIQACVSAKVPELMKEGHSQTEAVAMAVSMCSTDKGCAPSDLTDDDWAGFMTMVPPDSSKTSQKDMNATNTADNLHIQLLQQMVQGLAVLGSKLDSVVQVLTAYMAKDQTDSATKQPTTTSAPDSEEGMKSLITEARELNARLKSFLQ